MILLGEKKAHVRTRSGTQIFLQCVSHIQFLGSRRSDTQQVPHWGPTNICLHCTRFSRSGNRVSGICVLLPLCLIYPGTRRRWSASSSDFLEKRSRYPLYTWLDKLQFCRTSGTANSRGLQSVSWAMYRLHVTVNLLISGPTGMEIATTDTDWVFFNWLRQMCVLGTADLSVFLYRLALSIPAGEEIFVASSCLVNKVYWAAQRHVYCIYFNITWSWPN